MNDASKHKEPVSGTQPASEISDSDVIDILKHLQKIILEDISTPFGIFIEKLEAHLFEKASEAKSNQEQSDLFMQERLLKKGRAQIEQYFKGYLGEGFIKFKKGELLTEVEEEPDTENLSLIENAELEESLALLSASRRASGQNSELIWLLNRRMAVLNDGVKVQEANNPLVPIQYCESLRKALLTVDLASHVKIESYEIFYQDILVNIGASLKSVNDYLIQKGILPHLKYRPGKTVQGGVSSQAQANDMGLETWEQFGGEQPVQVEGTVEGGYSEAGYPEGAYADGGTVGQPVDGGSASGQAPIVDAIRTLQAHIRQFGGGGAPAPSTAGAPSATAPSSPSSAQPAMTAGGSATGIASGPSTIAGSAGGVAPTGSVPTVNVPASPSQFIPVSQMGTPVGDALQRPVASGPSTIFDSKIIMGALQNIQSPAETLVSSDIQTLQPVGPKEVAEDLRKQILDDSGEEDGSVDVDDMQTIELVGMLFQYMLSDENLPDSVKALLSYMHTPFLKLAFIDRDFFEQSEHPARLLLNSLAEAGVRWVGNDGSVQHDIYNKIKGVVSKILDEFKADVRIFAELLLDFSGYTKKIARRQDLLERRATEKTKGEEQLREVKLAVNAHMKKKIHDRELPSAVLLMLLQPWSDYLAFVMLRFGERSEACRKALEVVDQVLWSIEPKTTTADKSRQMEIHEDLMSSLEEGFEAIGYERVKGKKLLEALFSLQKMALQAKKIEPAPEPMRAKLEIMAAKKAGSTGVSEGEATPQEQSLIEKLKMIEFGTWFEFSGGKRLKVAWYNNKTLHYMLVDQMGKKVAMRSGLELARSMLRKEAKIVSGSSKPFFERALENIFESLNEQAGPNTKAGLSAKGDHQS